MLACALWRSAGSLTLCVALLGSVAAVLSVRGAPHPVLRWASLAALIALSVVTQRVPGPGVPRARCGQLGRAGPAEQHVPGGADGPLTGAAPLDRGARVMQGERSVLNLLLPRRWP